MASHRRAIFRPTSGGLGFGSEPLRTARNCSQTVRDGTDRTGESRRDPNFCISRRSPQIPVRSVARSQKIRTSEP